MNSFRLRRRRSAARSPANSKAARIGLAQAALLLSLCLAGDAASCRRSPTSTSVSVGLLTARPYGTTNAPHGFYEFLPSGYGPARERRPLLVFLHGVGQNGDGRSELPRVLDHGPLNLIASGTWPPVARPPQFVILSPQHRPAPVDPSVGFDCPTDDEIHRFLTFAIANYHVDPNRVYLTGLSCGAIGAWHYLGKFLAQQVTAAVLIAGDGRSATAARGCELANALPIWAFHGDADAVVPLAGTVAPMNRLSACPQPPRREQRATIYRGVGHDSWTQTYGGSDPTLDIYGWMLQFSRQH